MTQDVLTTTGKVFPCRTTSRMTGAELNSETEKSKYKKKRWQDTLDIW